MQASFYEYLQNPKICELFLCKDEKQADLLAQVSRFKGLKPLFYLILERSLEMI